MTPPSQPERRAVPGAGIIILVTSAVLTIVALLVPMMAWLTIPFVLGAAVLHIRAAARTAGSPTPFMVLVGLDIAMLIAVAGSLIVGF